MTLAPEVAQSERYLERKPSETGPQQIAVPEAMGHPLGRVAFGAFGAGEADDSDVRLASKGVLQRRAGGELREQVFRRVQQTAGNHKAQQYVAQLHSSVVQRQCACGGVCASCQSKTLDDRKSSLLLRQSSTDAAVGRVKGDVIPAGSAGQPLDVETRSFMESRLGADFDDVRIHADAPAQDSARALAADAYTSGRDIYFAAGKYAPESREGKHLLAHELTHTVQQKTGAAPSSAQRHGDVLIGSKDDPLEAQADRAADAAVEDDLGAAVPRPEAVRQTRDSGNVSNALVQREPAAEEHWYNISIPFTDYEFDPSIKGVETAASLAKDTAVEAFDWVVDKIKSLVSSAVDWLEDRWASIKEMASAAFDEAKAAFNGIIRFFGDPLGALANAMMSLDPHSIERVWNSLSGVIAKIADGFKTMVDGVLEPARAVWRVMDGFATSMLDQLSGLTQNFVFRKLPNALQSLAFAAIDRLKGLWNRIKGWWTERFNAIKSWIDGAIDRVFRFVRRVLSFGINVVVNGIIAFGQVVIFLMDLFAHPQKYIAILAQDSVKAFDGVERRFAGYVGQYFGAMPGAATLPAGPATVQRTPAASPAEPAKTDASWSEIGDGVLAMMGEKWAQFKANPMAVVTNLLIDLVFPLIGNVKDLVKLYEDIKEIVTGPLSASSLEELWTSILKILDIPILIYKTVVSILMRSLMLPLIVATFIPHPVVKAIAAAVGESLLAAFVEGEVLSLSQKLLLLRTGRTTRAEKQSAYNSIADSLIALAMTAAIIIIMLILNFLGNVMKGIYNFIRGKVIAVEPVAMGGDAKVLDKPEKGSGEIGDEPKSESGKDGQPDVASGERVAAQRPGTDGHTLKILEDGRVFICTTCEELRFKYESEINQDEDLRTKLADAEGTADPEAKADKVQALQKELAAAREKKLDAEPPELKGQFLSEMRAAARKAIGEIKERLRQRAVIDTLLEKGSVKGEIEAELRSLDSEMTRTEEGATGVDGDPQLEDAARDEFDNVRAKAEALKERLESEVSGRKVPGTAENTAAEEAAKAANVTAPIDFEGHIFNAEVKANGDVVGGHSTATGQVKIIPETASTPNSNGVYKARIEIADPNNPGQFLEKTNNEGYSTMFPDSWSADRVKIEVDAAFKNKVVTGSMWKGTTPSGVEVMGYLTPKTTVFPLY